MAQAEDTLVHTQAYTAYISISSPSLPMPKSIPAPKYYKSVFKSIKPEVKTVTVIVTDWYQDSPNP